MSIYTQTIQGVYSALPSAVRTATTIVLGKDLIDPKNANPMFSSGINPEVSGLVAYLNVTAVPGGDTVLLALEEQDPNSGVWSSVISTAANAAAGMMRMKVKQAIQTITATATQVQYQDTLPAIWRIRIIHSGAGAFTYSLGVVLYN